MLTVIILIISIIILFIYSACVSASRADSYSYKEDSNECRRIKKEN